MADICATKDKKFMKAVWFEKFGPAREVLILGEKATPVPQANEVLIKIKTSAVNPSDVKKRNGSFPNMLDESDCIPHSDGSGDIVAVGADVSKSRIGQRVWVYQAQFARMFGSCAEYLAIDTRRAVLLPDEASYEEGACLGIPAMTAHRCVFSDKGVKGQNVLITGGAGRVGFYAIQWAKFSGATVIATASNEEDKAACLAVGADHVVNHRSETWVDDILEITGEAKIQRAIDVEFGENLPSVLKMMSVNGVIATYSSTQVPEPKLPFFQMMYLDLTIRLVIVYAMPEAAKVAAIEDISAALTAGRLQHRIAKVYPVAEVVASHEDIESGQVRGCVLVTI